MTDVVVPDPPILVTIPRVELIDVGHWDISNVAGWEPSPADIANAVAALDCPAVRRPVLKLGHVPSPGDPALGFVDNLDVAEDGMLLVGDYAGVPSWLASTDASGKTVIASAYPDRSVEGEYDYVCQLGHTHPFVVHAVALLGVERPGVGTLQSLIDLYGEAPQPVESAVTASAPKETPMPAPVAAAATTDDVRRAYYAGPGSAWDLWIREMYVDPPELIIESDADGSLSRVTYAVADDGAVTFGEPQKVQVQYVAARAAAQRPVIAWASHAEARPGQPPEPQAPVAPVTGQEEGAGMDPAKLREDLGLPADASETEVAAKLAADGLIPQISEPAAPAAPPAAEPVTPPTADQVAASADDHVRIPKTGYDELVANASAGAKAATQLHEQQREAFLDTVKAKFMPANRDAWRKEYDKDPEATRTYFATAADIIPLTPGGYSATEDAESGEFDHLFPPTAQEG